MKLKIAVIIVVALSILLSTFDGKSQSDMSETKLLNPYGTSTSNYLSLKGQLHAHSNNSDGWYSPQVVAEMYRDLGYDFLTITDHNVITQDPGVDGITWIGNSVEESHEKHFTVYDVDDGRTDRLYIQEIINIYAGRGKLISLAHPSFDYKTHRYEIPEVNNYENYNMIEVHNGLIAATGGNQNDDAYWDEALKEQNVWGIATDDFHKAGYADNGWVVVFVESNTKEDILNALRVGRFYASSGNDLNVSVSNNEISVSSTHESRFYFVGENGIVLKEDSNVLQSTYVVTGSEKYVRVRSEREDGLGMAWSQPIRITKYYYYLAGVDGYR